MTVNDYLSALGWPPDKAAQKAQERPIPKFQRKNTPKPDPEAENLYDLASRNLKANLNVKESLQWMQQAADMGHCLACHQMALLLEDGKLVKKDREGAIAYARKSAQMDYFQAQQYLGELLQKEGRYEEAAEWLRKAAEQGVGQAAVLLAQLYEDGQGVPLDRVEAAFWYKVALKDFFFLNRDAAQQSLQRLEGADGYLEQIAQKPVNDFLGVEKLYEKGSVWNLQHEPENIACLIHAAALGDPWSAFLLAKIFCSKDAKTYGIYNEELSRKCFHEALPLLEKLAEEGNIRAVESLADLYLDGIKADSGTVLVQANPDKSDKLYLQGAQMGNRECQFLIGKSFRLSGNASEALVYLRQAADQGQPAAAYLAGEMLEKGEGGPADKEAAKHYYAIAAANQLHAYHQHAAAALQRLGKKSWWPFW